MKTLDQEIIYQIFVRNYSDEGKLRNVEEDLKRIKEVGTDIIYLMPVSPIGEIGRKGSLGSPYAIKDYRKVDDSLGGETQLISLCNKAHKMNMKVILDMVFNHTSRDSILSKEHPEYFYHDNEGRFANKIGNWSDVIDLDHSNDELETYLLDVLRLYESYGVDGFRFDVASLIPASFFKKARKALKKESILLAECVDTSFVNEARSINVNALSNQELLDSGFDVLYPYSYFQPLHEYLQSKDKVKLEQFKFAYQLATASISKEGKITMSIENHDRERLASYSHDENFTRSILMMTFFSKGPAFVYAGEEYEDRELPNLFEKDVINKKSVDKAYFDFYLSLVNLKKREKNSHILQTLIQDSDYDTVLMKNTFLDDKEEYGLFNFSGSKKPFQIPKGTYKNLIGNEEIENKTGAITTVKPLWLVRNE